jgi:starch-binding outer membrane protein, SusD/RagB family
MKATKIYISILLLIPFVSGCEKILNVEPTTSLNSQGVISNKATATGAVRGMYHTLQSASYYGQLVLVWGDLASDNLRHSGTFTTDQEVDANDVLPSNVSMQNVWGQLYYSISTANYILRDVSGVKDMDDSLKNQYRGEAYFVRALAYFNLVRSFGKVPIVETPVSSLSQITLPARSAVADVYALIESDLDSSMALIPPGFNKLNTADANGQATASAAMALKARVSLFEQKWQDAMDYANQIIESGEFSLATNYSDIFDYTRKYNAETIFEVDFTVLNSNALAFWFYPSGYGGRLEYEPTPELVAAYNHNDARFLFNIGEYQNPGDTTTYYAVGKYNDIASGSDNVIVIRLAEMYLIRAEAALHGATNPSGLSPLDDINTIHQRANLLPLATVTLGDVLNERRLEFAFEGYRWYDLTRTGTAQAFVSTVTGANQYIWPVPQQELDVNTNLKPQNDGY